MEITLGLLLLEEVSLFSRKIYFSVGKLHIGMMAPELILSSKYFPQFHPKDPSGNHGNCP
jgi:hypothetical protein